MSATKDRAAIAELLAGLASEDLSVRALAAQHATALAGRRRTRLGRELVEALRPFHGAMTVRNRAAQALGAAMAAWPGARRAGVPLLRRAIDEDRAIEGAAALALGVLASGVADEELAEAVFGHARASVRAGAWLGVAYASAALTGIAGPLPTTLVARMRRAVTDDPTSAVRREAARAAEAWKRRAALERTRERLSRARTKPPGRRERA